MVEGSFDQNWVRWIETVDHNWLKIAGTDGGVDSSVYGFVGNKGGGKTLTMSDSMLFTHRAHPFQRFVCVDTNMNFSGFYFRDTEDGGRVPVQADFRSLPAGLCCVYTPATMHLVRKHFRSAPFHIVRMIGLSPEARAAAIRRLIAIVMSLGGCTLVLDELPKFSKDGQRDTFKKANGMVEGLDRIITEGRHIFGCYGKGVSLLWAVQSTKYITKDVLDQSDAIFAHKIQRPTDARMVLSDWWGGIDRISLHKLSPPACWKLMEGGYSKFIPGERDRRKPGYRERMSGLVLKGLAVPCYY